MNPPWGCTQPEFYWECNVQIRVLLPSALVGRDSGPSLPPSTTNTGQVRERCCSNFVPGHIAVIWQCSLLSCLSVHRGSHEWMNEWMRSWWCPYWICILTWPSLGQGPHFHGNGKAFFRYMYECFQMIDQCTPAWDCSPNRDLPLRLFNAWS